MKFITALSLKVKIIIIACTVAAAAAVGAVIIVNSEDAYRVIKVFELNGSAVVTRENTGDIDAYAGMNLESGDTLSVEENSTLRISLDSDKYILLDGGTVLNLTAQGTAADSRTVIELQTGTILNEIKNSLSANSSYEVNTPKATMAVRGTTFTVTTRENPDGSYVTELRTEEGTVSVQLFDENGEPKGAEIYVPKGGAVTILTEVNNETGNPADVDGDPHFVFPNGDGTFTDCGDSDPVYYPDNNVSAEAQTEQTERTEQTTAAVPSDTVITETSGTASEPRSETKPTVTEVPVYKENLPVSDVPTVTSVPAEIGEPKPVIPSEISSETTAETTKAAERETTVTSALQKEREETEESLTNRTESQQTTAAAAITDPIPFYSETRPPIYTYPPATTPSQTVPTMSSVPIIPTETSPNVTTETSPNITTETSPNVTAETEPPAESLPISSETSPSESSETDITSISESPHTYRVSFIDENGNIISASDHEDSETVGVLPEISEKKGYTGKWVSGGTEVTENTVISGDMEITAEYTPRPVTVHIYAPIYNNPASAYDSVLTFTTLYDSSLSDNSEGYNIASLTEYVDGLYADYYENYGRDYALSSISFNGVPDAVSDASAISGDCVYEDGGQLYAIVYFNYERSGGA